MFDILLRNRIKDFRDCGKRLAPNVASSSNTEGANASSPYSSLPSHYQMTWMATKSMLDRCCTPDNSFLSCGISVPSPSFAILGGCAGSACVPESGAPSNVFTLYFGTTVQGRGGVTMREWQAFVDDTVTANVPDGYTVFDATGAWMNRTTRTITRESTKVLVVALPDVADSLAAVNRIRTAYQARFHQQLVGMTVQPACAAF